MTYYHLAELIYRRADRYGVRAAISYRNEVTRSWSTVSWSEFATKIRSVSASLLTFGIGIQEHVGICAPNVPERFFIDFGLFGIRGVSVPIYATSSASQIAYIIKDASIRLLFVGEQQQYDRALEVQRSLGTLERLVIIDSSVVRTKSDTTSLYFDEFLSSAEPGSEDTVSERLLGVTPEDVASIVYTSGTTGEPKGVILTHANYLELLRIHDIRLPMVNDRDVSMSFLPLTHIFEQAWSYYCFHKGVQVAVNRDPKLIRQTLLEVQPTLMCNVPRFWEKVYAGVQEKISSSPPLMRWLFVHAIKTGHAYHLDYRRTSRRAPLTLRLMFWLYDRLVFAKLKRVLGLKYGRLFPVAGAPLSDTILEFLLSVNIPLRYGYGLSETSATVCFHPESGYTIGSIGTLMPDISVRIDPANDEILVKGGTITSGYYRKPEATAEVFTADGYFRTGDAGWLEGDTLFFRERIKDLYKTSNGKYIAPQAIEMSLSVSHYIEQCAVIADSRKFVSALIVPAFAELEEYARSIGLPSVDRATLLNYVEIRALYEGIISDCQHDFAPYERIKRFVLLPAPFTMESGELTDTLKLRRPVIASRYASEIDSMYREIPEGQ